MSSHDAKIPMESHALHLANEEHSGTPKEREHPAESSRHHEPRHGEHTPEHNDHLTGRDAPHGHGGAVTQ